MKSLLILAATLFALSAQAEVKPEGTVLVDQCGSARETDIRMGGFTIVRVCTASVVGVEGKFVAVTESKVTRAGAEKMMTLWRIAGQSPDFGPHSILDVVQAGATDEDGIFRWGMATVQIEGKIRVTKTRDGSSIVSMKGILDGRGFTASKFQTIFHTM